MTTFDTEGPLLFFRYRQLAIRCSQIWPLYAELTDFEEQDMTAAEKTFRSEKDNDHNLRLVETSPRQKEPRWLLLFDVILFSISNVLLFCCYNNTRCTTGGPMLSGGTISIRRRCDIPGISFCWICPSRSYRLALVLTSLVKLRVANSVLGFLLLGNSRGHNLGQPINVAVFP